MDVKTFYFQAVIMQQYPAQSHVVVTHTNGQLQQQQQGQQQQEVAPMSQGMYIKHKQK